MEESTVKLPSISVKRIVGLIPRSQDQLEVELKGILRVVFWAALLAPVILVPLYYLALALLR